MCQGMPVEKAQIFFEPIRSRATGPKDETSSKIGKIGYALTDATGEFKVSTYGEGDGAVIGHHKVRVGAPSSSEFKCECYCNANKPLMEVDVVEGKANEFTLTLRLPTADEAAKSASSDETEWILNSGYSRIYF